MFLWRIVWVLAFAICLLPHAAAWASPFQNGDFSAGFAGWSGQLDDGSETSLSVDPAADQHFSLDSQGASIHYSDLSDPFWIISLYQSFQVEALQSSDHRLKFGLWLQWSSPTDILSATLGSADLLQGIDFDTLLGGTFLEFDVTHLASLPIELAFTIGDLDFNTPDILKISNISFYQEKSQTAPVPEPASLLLLGAGLAGLSYLRKR